MFSGTISNGILISNVKKKFFKMVAILKPYWSFKNEAIPKVDDVMNMCGKLNNNVFFMLMKLNTWLEYCDFLFGHIFYTWNIQLWPLTWTIKISSVLSHDEWKVVKICRRVRELWVIFHPDKQAIPQTHKQTVRRTDLPKCKFWQVHSLSNIIKNTYPEV